MFIPSVILAYNKSALCCSASSEFSFVLFYILSDVWLQHLFNQRSGKRNQSVIFTCCVDLCIQTLFPICPLSHKSKCSWEQNAVLTGPFHQNGLMQNFRGKQCIAKNWKTDNQHFYCIFLKSVFTLVTSIYANLLDQKKAFT